MDIILKIRLTCKYQNSTETISHPNSQREKWAPIRPNPNRVSGRIGAKLDYPTRYRTLSEGFVSHLRIIILWTSFEVPSYHTISRHVSLLSCHDKIFIYNTKQKKIHKVLNKSTSSFYTHHTRPVPKTFPSYSLVANLPHQNFVRSRT